MNRFLLCLLTGVVALSLVVSDGHARVFEVPARYKTIQRGIDAASPGDTVLVGPGVYKENLTVRKSISLIGKAGPSKTVIDGQKRDVVLRCEEVDSTAVISGFTFRNGLALHGGGVLLSSSFPRVFGNIFKGDSATYGGGLCALWSNSRIEGNEFVDNRAAYGGAIYTMFIAPEIDSNVIKDNRARNGGGIYAAKSSEVTVSRNSITGNRAERGGGLFLNGASPTVENNVFTRNTAKEGGAISSITSDGIISHNTFWRNSGATGAAVALLQGAAPDLVNNTIVANTSVDTLSAGIYCYSTYSDIRNNVLADNSPGYSIYCAEDAAPVLSCNLFWNSGTGDYFGVITETTEIRADPLFCDPGKGDFSLKEGSPALSDSCGVVGAHSECERRSGASRK